MKPEQVSTSSKQKRPSPSPKIEVAHSKILRNLIAGRDRLLGAGVVAGYSPYHRWVEEKE
jgi:hypothetical protein